MDGVITDNNAYHEKAWEDFCRSYQVTLTPDEVRHYIFGRVARDTLEYVFKKTLSRAEINAYVEEKEKIYREIYQNFIKPLDGLLSFLGDLRNHRIRLAMATSAPPGNVEFTFSHIPVREYFDVVLDGDSIEKGKPHPDIYLKAISLLRLMPDQCVIFEDSIPGIKAALASGAHVIGVATTHKREELKGVNKIIKDFSEISLTDLRQMACH